MPIVRWVPFREMIALQNRIAAAQLQAWAPAVDIYETEKEIVLKADLPEVKLEDVDIRVENNTLTLRGERRFEKDVKEENFHRVERSHGSFSRAFTLPGTVDCDKIEAALHWMIG